MFSFDWSKNREIFRCRFYALEFQVESVDLITCEPALMHNNKCLFVSKSKWSESFTWTASLIRWRAVWLWWLLSAKASWTALSWWTILTWRLCWWSLTWRSILRRWLLRRLLLGWQIRTSWSYKWCCKQKSIELQIILTHNEWKFTIGLPSRFLCPAAIAKPNDNNNTKNFYKKKRIIAEY